MTGAHLTKHLLSRQVLSLITPDFGQVKPGSVRLGWSHLSRILLLRKFLKIMLCPRSTKIHDSHPFDENNKDRSGSLDFSLVLMQISEAYKDKWFSGFPYLCWRCYHSPLLTLSERICSRPGWCYQNPGRKGRDYFSRLWGDQNYFFDLWSDYFVVAPHLSLNYWTKISLLWTSCWKWCVQNDK